MHVRRVVKLFLLLPIFLLFFALIGWAVMGLWNWLLPAIFAARAITYWQALGLMALCWILFGGLRGRRPSGGSWRHGMRERWGKMNPSEREEFARGLRSKWHDMRERWDKMSSSEREAFLKSLPHFWQDILDRWGRMTPEERDEFVKGLRSRSAGGAPEPEWKA